MSDIFIIEPVATENEIPSPSFEDPDNALDDVQPRGISTITRSLEAARFGRASAKVVNSGTHAAEGIRYNHDPSAAAEPRATSVYVRGEGSVRLRTVDFTNGLEWTGQPIQLTDDYWQRLEGVMWLGAVTCTDFRIYVETPDEAQAITFYVDGYQCEPQGFVTDYTDGDLETLTLPHPGLPWFKWNGSKHNSSSTRSGRYRRGGRPLMVTEGLYSQLWPTNISGFGMPPIRTNVQQFTDLTGLQVQQQKAQSRTLGMNFFASKDPDEKIGIPADLRPLHIAREALERVIKPDLVQETQPVMIEYRNRRAPMRIPSYYEAGLEFTGDIRFPYQNSFGVRFLTEDPFWTVDSQDVCELALSRFASMSHLAARIDGVWVFLECNGFVQVIEVDPATNEIWVGGRFTTIDPGTGPVTVNRIAKISADATTVTPVGQVPGIDDGWVNAIAFLTTGDVIVGGDFIDIDAVDFNFVALWDKALDTFIPMGPDPGLDNLVHALAVKNDQDTVFIGGEFSESFSGSVTPLNNICEYSVSGDDFSGMVGASGNGVNDTVRATIMDVDGTTLLFGGPFTQETGAGANTLKRVASWDGSTFDQLSQDGSEEEILGLSQDLAGNTYAVGKMTNIGFTAVDKVAMFNRVEWYPLGVAGDGVTGGVDGRCCDVRDDGLVIIGGDFTGATGIKAGFVKQLATWDGFRFGFMDIQPAPDASIIACRWNHKDLWIGGEFPQISAPGTGEVSEVQTCTNHGRAKSNPILEIYGPADVYWLENLTTGQLAKFELEVKDQEVVTVNLTPGHQSVVSDQRGNLIQDMTPDSDVIDLLPGDNRIVFYSRFHNANQTEVTLRWPIRAWSFDD